MADIVSNLIQTLKRASMIGSQPSLVATLTAIDKYGDNDFSKAYLLGHFFKSEIDTDKLLPADKNILISTIKQNNLDNPSKISHHLTKVEAQSDKVSDFYFCR